MSGQRGGAPGRLAEAGPDAPWSELTVCVAGLGVSGRPAARVLLRLGARVVVVEGRSGPEQVEQATALEALGARVVLGASTGLPPGTQLVVTSPGWRPDAEPLASARAAGVPVWGDVELAWRLRGPGAPPWLAVTGTNGKTTVVRMLTCVLLASGRRAVAAGNVGTPLLDVALDSSYDVLAVELSSFQLHWAPSVRPLAATVLNVAPDHLDWHGSLEAYASAKAAVWAPGTVVVYNADDAWSTRLGHDRPGAVSFTLGPPDPGQLGVLAGRLVDRAFPDGGELAAVDDVVPPAPHNVANALAAAALARAAGVTAPEVREGLRAFRPDPHRIAHVRTVGGVAYVDDSKATNPHAAAASLAAYRPVVWIAGGLAKGATFDDLVAGAAERLRGVVLLGRDRAVVADALRRHAPDVPVVEVAATDTGAMDRVVEECARLARPGDTVLLAPACASMDMFASYAERGDAFAAAVRALPGPA